MALQASYLFRGLTAQSAYIRIERISIDLITRQCDVFASIYADSDSRLAGVEPLDTYYASFTVDPTKAIPSQAYAALKAAIAGAVDA